MPSTARALGSAHVDATAGVARACECHDAIVGDQRTGSGAEPRATSLLPRRARDGSRERSRATVGGALLVLLAVVLMTGPVEADPTATSQSSAVSPKGATAQCIDQEIADRLALKRKRRGTVDRLFVKQHRHELAAGGGYYNSDLLSGTYVLSASYTYHMTDETAVEFGAAYTHANADVIRALEDKRGVALGETYARMMFAESLLDWSPVYGKLRLGGSVVHLDLHLDVGVGVIDSKTSRGAAGVVGFGTRLFIGQAAAFKIDLRNRTFRQELLDEHFLVNDTAITASLAIFLPFHN